MRLNGDYSFCVIAVIIISSTTTAAIAIATAIAAGTVATASASINNFVVAVAFDWAMLRRWFDRGCDNTSQEQNRLPDMLRQTRPSGHDQGEFGKSCAVGGG